MPALTFPRPALDAAPRAARRPVAPGAVAPAAADAALAAEADRPPVRPEGVDLAAGQSLLWQVTAGDHLQIEQGQLRVVGPVTVLAGLPWQPQRTLAAGEPLVMTDAGWLRLEALDAVRLRARSPVRRGGLAALWRGWQPG